MKKSLLTKTNHVTNQILILNDNITDIHADVALAAHIENKL